VDIYDPGMSVINKALSFVFSLEAISARLD